MHDNGKPEELNAFARFWVDVWRCVRRVFSGNFQTVRVTDREAAKLARSSTSITEPVGQSYAAWRRSALWIAAIALFVHVVVQLSTFRFQETRFRKQVDQAAEVQIKAMKKQIRDNPQAEFQLRAVNPELHAVVTGRTSKSSYVAARTKDGIKQFGQSNLSLLDGIIIVGLVIAAVSGIFVLLSAIFWSNLGWSRLLARIGWGVMFATPVLLALLPLSSMMDFSHIKNDVARKVVVAALGAAFALQVLVTEGAKVLALFPGIIRSSMGLKTLLPESAAPGWIVALIAPIYALVLMLFLVTANQLQGNWLLVAAALLLMLAPLIYLFFAKAVVRPHEAKELNSVIIPIRLAVVAVNSAGLVFLSIWVLDLPGMTIGEVLKFIFGLIANVLLLTVVVTDIVIQTLRAGYIQTQGFQESRLREKLDYRFAALAQIGRRRTPGEPPVPDIPGRAAGEPVFADALDAFAAADPSTADATPFGRLSRGSDDSLVIE